MDLNDLLLIELYIDLLYPRFVIIVRHVDFSGHKFSERDVCFQSNYSID